MRSTELSAAGVIAKAEAACARVAAPEYSATAVANRNARWGKREQNEAAAGAEAIVKAAVISVHMLENSPIEEGGARSSGRM
jgi:hypothetical protein